MMSGPVKSWSFSRWTDYEQCPRKFKFKVLDRLPEPPNPAMKRGIVLHKMAELYIRGEKITRANVVDDKGGALCTASEFTQFHKEWKACLKRFQEEFDELRELHAQTEISWTFTKDWKSETRWDDWANAWVRIKVDCYDHDPDNRRARIIDWKTGRARDSHTDQLELYAIAGFIVFPDVEEIDAILGYLDSGEVVKRTYKRKALAALKRTWAKRVRAMLSDREFKPRPGPLCRWCHYRKSNGGPCEFGE